MRETMCFDESAVRYDAESASGRKSNHGLSASAEMDPNDPRFDQLRATISAELDSVIEDLRGEIKSLKETQKAQEAKMLRRPKPCLPDPERFIGTDVKFDAWSASIKAKLAIDGEAIGNSKAQFFYVYLCLDSIAQRAVLPQLDHANDVNRYNYRAILDQLKILYDKPDGVPRATIHTSSRKQGSYASQRMTKNSTRQLHDARMGSMIVQGVNWI